MFSQSRNPELVQFMYGTPGRSARIPCSHNQGIQNLYNSCTVHHEDRPGYHVHVHTIKKSRVCTIHVRYNKYLYIRKIRKKPLHHCLKNKCTIVLFKKYKQNLNSTEFVYIPPGNCSTLLM